MQMLLSELPRIYVDGIINAIAFAVAVVLWLYPPSRRVLDVVAVRLSPLAISFIVVDWSWCQETSCTKVLSHSSGPVPT
jgi:hypothetical protein